MRVYALGDWEVRLTGLTNAAMWSGPQSQALFKYLLAAERYRRRVEETIEVFWPNASLPRGREYLRRCIMQLRRTLEPARDSYAASTYVVTDRRLVSLQIQQDDRLRDAPAIWFDGHEFEALTVRALNALDRGELISETADQALEFYRGPFLADSADVAWADRARDRYQRLWAMLVSGLARAQTARGQFDRAVLLLGKLVEASPDDEDACFRLMVAHAASGRRGHAVRVFESLRRNLATSIDAQPAERFYRLLEAIRAGRSMEPWLAATSQYDDVRAASRALG